MDQSLVLFILINITCYLAILWNNRRLIIGLKSEGLENWEQSKKYLNKYLLNFALVLEKTQGTLWDKGLSCIILSFKFFDFGLKLKYQNQY